MDITTYQTALLESAFGLGYSKVPYRNYYLCNKTNEHWEDLVSKGLATKRDVNAQVVYFGTHEGLKRVFQENVSLEWFKSI